MTTVSHERYDELAAGYALDALGLEERAEFERHSETCATCAAAVSSYASVASSLAFTVPQVSPAASLRPRVMEAVRAERVPEIAVRGWLGAWSRPVRLAMAAMLASFALVVGSLSFWIAELREDEQRYQTVLDRSYDALSVMAAADTRWAISGTDASVGAHGIVAYDADAGASSVVIWGLSEDPELRYNVWVRDANERTRVARLYASEGGFWAVVERDVSESDGFGVTLVSSDGEAVDMVDTTLAAN